MPKLYKVTITGWVVQDDFVNIPPSEWGSDNVIREMVGEQVTEVLLDTIEDNDPEPTFDEQIIARIKRVKAIEEEYEEFKNHWCSLVWHEGSIVRSDTYTTYREAHEYALGRAESRYGEEWLEQNKHNVPTYFGFDTETTNDLWDNNEFLAGNESSGYSVCRYSHIPKDKTTWAYGYPPSSITAD